MVHGTNLQIENNNGTTILLKIKAKESGVYCRLFRVRSVCLCPVLSVRLACAELSSGEQCES